MKLVVAAACATGCLSTPGSPACELHMFAELITPGGRFESPWLSPDHLTIYFASHANGSDVIARATRASANVAFDPPNPVGELALPNGDVVRDVTLSSDQLEIWISCTGGAFYYASRASTAAAFAPPTRLLMFGPRSLSLLGTDLLAFYSRGDGVIRITTRASRDQMFDFGTAPGVPGFPPASPTFFADACSTDPSGATLYCAVYTADPTDRLVAATSDLGRYVPQAMYALAPLDVELAPEAGRADYDPMIDADARTLVFASERDPAPANAQSNLWAYCE